MTKMKKHYVAHGQFQGETAVITRKVNKNTVMVELVDDHGKVISDEPFPMPVGFLEPM